MSPPPMRPGVDQENPKLVTPPSRVRTSTSGGDAPIRYRSIMPSWRLSSRISPQSMSMIGS